MLELNQWRLMFYIFDVTNNKAHLGAIDKPRMIP